MLDAMSNHHLMEDLATRHAHKAMVHLRLSERLQWLHVPHPAGILAVEGRTGHRPLRHACRCGLRSLGCGVRHIAPRRCLLLLKGRPFIRRHRCRPGAGRKSAPTCQALDGVLHVCRRFCGVPMEWEVREESVQSGRPYSLEVVSRQSRDESSEYVFLFVRPPLERPCIEKLASPLASPHGDKPRRAAVIGQAGPCMFI
jgi:hypothetical protein